jgi:hypothetical protein
MSRLLMVLGISIVILAADRSRGQDQNPPSSKEAQAEIARLQKELKSLVEEVRRRDAIIRRLAKEAKSFRDEAVASQNALVPVKNRLENLLEQVREKDRTIAELRAAVGEKATEKPNFPAKFVKGTITKVEVKGGLVEIDLGRSAGIAKGHHLEVFRVKPRAQYLGRIRIIEVLEEKSVGRLESGLARNQVLQVGDSVASKLEP